MFNDETPEQAIREAEAMQGTQEQEFDPYKNAECIAILKQRDGNWKLFGQKHGKIVEIRGIKPEDCLAEFITHE